MTFQYGALNSLRCHGSWSRRSIIEIRWAWIGFGESSDWGFESGAHRCLVVFPHQTLVKKKGSSSAASLATATPRATINYIIALAGSASSCRVCIAIAGHPYPLEQVRVLLESPFF